MPTLPDVLPRLPADMSWSEYARMLGFTDVQSVNINIIGIIVQRYNQQFMPISRVDLVSRADEALARNGYKDPTKPMPPTKDQEREVRLIRARELLLKEQRQRQAASSQYTEGSKAGDYLKMLRNKKKQNRSLEEIKSSEVPVLLTELNESQWQEMRRMPNMQLGSEPSLLCTTCKIKVHYNYMAWCSGRLTCLEHIRPMILCIVCDHMREAEGSKLVDSYDGKKIAVCYDCTHNVCSSCEEELPLKNAEIGFCDNCMDQSHSTRAGGRQFSYSLKWVGKDKGAVYKSGRMFSCELEALSPIRDYATYLGKKLPKEMGIGTDGSVRGAGYGFEIQTPRLGGKKGEELVHRITATVKEIKATLNESCGMHIHLDGIGLMPEKRTDYPTAIIQTWKAYLAFEDVILSFIPFSRRYNDFCRPLGSSFQAVELDLVETIGELEQLLYKEHTYPEIRAAKGQHYHPSRYFGVNMDSLLKDGHLEIRYHSATLNPKKVLEWANLHALIMDAAAQGKFTPALLQEALGTLRLREKAEMLFNAISLSHPSKQYFFERQKKFGNKKTDEDELIKTEEKIYSDGASIFSGTGMFQPRTDFWTTLEAIQTIDEASDAIDSITSTNDES